MSEGRTWSSADTRVFSFKVFLMLGSLMNFSSGVISCRELLHKGE